AKKVTFAEDVKPAATENAEAEQGPVPVDGVIGQLEIHRSGAVKMRLADGIVMDVSAATQPSFLQQAVHIDPAKKNINVLGEVSRRFVVTPDIDTLLSAMLEAEQPAVNFDDLELIAMDTA
ncbi:hypothetical protein HETIRDRAFT_323441, partial [Heterobasidion irregulare TC 32-1]